VGRKHPNPPKNDVQPIKRSGARTGAAAHAAVARRAESPTRVIISPAPKPQPSDLRVRRAETRVSRRFVPYQSCWEGSKPRPRSADRSLQRLKGRLLRSTCRANKGARRPPRCAREGVQGESPGCVISQAGSRQALHVRRGLAKCRDLGWKRGSTTDFSLTRCHGLTIPSVPVRRLRKSPPMSGIRGGPRLFLPTRTRAGGVGAETNLIHDISVSNPGCGRRYRHTRSHEPRRDSRMQRRGVAFHSACMC